MTSSNAPATGEPAEEAIPRLFDEHGAKIYQLGVRLCGGPDDADDLVQETFLNAFRHWDDFEGRANPSTWLYTIASRACGRMHRLRAGEPRKMATLEELLPGRDAPIAVVPSAEDGPLRHVVRRETEEVVEQAISTLPTNYRIPLVLKEIVDFSLAEIAKILGIKESTVKTRVHRGRLLLRKALAAQLPKRDAPPPDHPRHVCLDLLQTKQEALDKGVPFPLPPAELCTRCRSLFATLDLAHDTCHVLADGALPDQLKSLMHERFAALSAQPPGRRNS